MSGHPLFARLYGRFAPLGESAGSAAHRDELLASASGRVFEVGAGSGLCFGHYPYSVTEVVAAEPEPYLRHLATQAAAAAPVPIRVMDTDAEHLPFDDATFDVVVASLVLCSVPDQQRALREVRRVLRPGGELRIYEHIRSEDPRHARRQDRIAWIWPHLVGGCHPNRDTIAAITQVGLRVQACRRFEFRLGAACAPVSPHVIGVAVRP
ncbi:MAG: class I SAM-dependent methyltransferase [Sciscionella sp.]